MSGCFVLALAAILAPMLVLFGLKFGIVGSMMEQLIEEPRNREIQQVGSGRFTKEWIDKLSQRSDVIFAVPRTRSIAATIQLSSSASPSILPVEIISSGPGDPLLTDINAIPDGMDRVVLSHSAANKLQVKPGDQIDGSLTRRYQGEKERVHLTLKVIGVASSRSFSREAAFTSLQLTEALEDFRDGRAVDSMGWLGMPRIGERTYPGFRIYARSIYDVAGLERQLNKAGASVRTKSGDIEVVQRMNRNLSMIYWAIAIIGLVGFSVSLGANLWANVERKRKELSVLRLVGFRTGDIIWFPMLQALYTALFGWVLAVVIFLLASWGINDFLTLQLDSGQQVCRLKPIHYLLALVLTCGSAILSAALAGLRSTRIEPAESLREI
jgi:putative ABC transport system permease protein